MSGFFTNEKVSLEKNVFMQGEIQKTELKNVDEVYDIKRCLKWIQENNYKRVCLQFPDHLLPDSIEICFRLQDSLKERVYIMGDTSYESCCLDFIAAAHVNADAVIHFGAVCFSQNIDKLPHLNVYEKFTIDIDVFRNKMDKFIKGKEDEIVILIDTPYLQKKHEIEKISKSFIDGNVFGLDEKLDFSKQRSYICICSNLRKLENLAFLIERNLYYFDPVKENNILDFQNNPLILKRRYFLEEKIKDAKTFAIVMGTLAVENYMKILNRMKKLLKLNGKKFYVISVGKISVAKLANFPEMDIYILVTCAMNGIYDNSKDFYKPIVTPCDVEKALNTKSSNIKFSYDFNSSLNEIDDEIQSVNEPDISLLSGNLRRSNFDDVNDEKIGNEDLVLKNEGKLIESEKFGAGFLSERSWRGLEQNLGKTEVHLAKEGKTGIAQSYSNERSETE